MKFSSSSKIRKEETITIITKHYQPYIQEIIRLFELQDPELDMTKEETQLISALFNNNQLIEDHQVKY